MANYDGTVTMEKDWNEEIRKCKEDKVYYFENYWVIDGKKPTKEAVERLREHLKDGRPIADIGRGRRYFK